MRADLRYLLAGLAGTAGFTFVALAFPDMSRLFTIPAAIACFILTVHLVWPDIREFAVSPRWGLKRMWPQYLMTISGILFFVGLIGFLQLNVTPLEPKKELPSGAEKAEVPLGFSAAAFMRLYDTPELRRKYIFDFLAPTNARFSFYVSPSDLFVFSVTDVNSEQYSLEVPIRNDAIPLSRHIFLYFEIALHNRSTGLRILVDGKQVAERTLGFRLELGKEYWKWVRSTIGADAQGANNAPFQIAMFSSGHVPLTDAQVISFQQGFEK